MTQFIKSNRDTFISHSQQCSYCVKMLFYFSILSNGTLVINKSKAKDEGQYLCKAKNGVGEGISKLAEVTINGKTL